MDYLEVKKYIYDIINENKYSNESMEILVDVGGELNDTCIQYIIKLTNCTNEIATQVFNDLKKDFSTIETNPYCPDLTPQQIAAANAQAQEWLNKPKCPICGSTNLSKLSNVGKAAKIGLFGIFGAGDLGKTWKCNNCGSKF